MFCTNCGKELSDNAYVCISCGALVRSEMAKNAKCVKKETEKGAGENNVLLKVLMLVAFLAAFIAIAFLLLSLAASWIDLTVYESAYSGDIYGYAVHYADYGIWVFALIFSLVCLAMAITQFIIGLIREKGFSTLKMLSIVAFALGVCVFVCTIIFGEFTL